MGNAKGAGSPNAFQCSKCRRNKHWDYRDDPDDRKAGSAFRVELTGAKAPYLPGLQGHAAGPRSSRHKRQYRCLDCRHLGWSVHVDLERKESGKGFKTNFKARK